MKTTQYAGYPRLVHNCAGQHSKAKRGSFMAARKLLALILLLVILSGCANSDGASSDPVHQDPEEMTEDPAEPSGIPSTEGIVKTFEFDGLTLEISNVVEIKKGHSFDGMENWEYDIYVVSSGAVAKVLTADTFLDEENGSPHANWAFLDSDGGRIDIMDGMEPLEITENILGIYDTESSLYVLGFEMYNIGEQN